MSRRIATAGPKDIRFKFGRNWSRFLHVLNDKRIAEAEKSLRTMLEFESLEGRSFLDIGSGSGLFSLAARRLGAAVVSFDYDPQSVACAEELKARYFPGDAGWKILAGSVLDGDFMKSLGTFDIVYSWGVLHHTGHMESALRNAVFPLASGGCLFIAIYNDQGFRTKIWRYVKRTYCSGFPGRAIVLGIFIPVFFLQGLFRDLFHGQNPARRYREYSSQRGMSVFHDWVDWLGGYPFEVAAPERIVDFYREKGLVLRKLVPGRGMGNNQFVFKN
jgi:2-polyprenyl-6-hydroxyphenyl methylase/3-demethylubiquinone-9 3-methyltransferase